MHSTLTMLILSMFLAPSISTSRVAVVTGGNRGLGYEIVKGLCEKFNGDVYLTARNEQRGLEAVKSLNELGLRPKFHLLDITVPETIETLRNHMLKHYGGIDVLVNNAAIYSDGTNSFESQACEVLRVNFFALRDLCKILFSILKSHARVVNLSSYAGHLSHIPGEQLRNILASSDLTEEKLSALMTSFVEAVKNGSHLQQGWPQWAYSVSKVGVSALTRIQQKELSNDEKRTDIIVNHVHPGYVDPDMSNTIVKGAEAPLFLALLPENCTSPKGDFVWNTKEVVDWLKGPLPHYDRRPHAQVISGYV